MKPYQPDNTLLPGAASSVCNQSTWRFLPRAVLLGLLFVTGQAQAAVPNTASDHAKLLPGNREALRSRASLMQATKDRLDLGVFILRPDKVGKSHMALLRDLARKGKEVRVLLDGFGSRGLPRELLRHLSDEGVLVRFYNAPGVRNLTEPLSVFRRMHDKLVVRDQEELITGGRNIEAAYFGLLRKPKESSSLS